MTLANHIRVAPDAMVAEAARLKRQGYRLVALTAVTGAPEQLDVLYHFDRELRLEHRRVTLPLGAALQSITAVYPAAFLVENEIQEQFGLQFSGLEPNYQGRLFLDHDSPRAPMAPAASGEAARHPAPSSSAAGDSASNEGA